MKKINEQTKSVIYFIVFSLVAGVVLWGMSKSQVFQKVVELVFWITIAYFVLDALRQREIDKKEEIKKEVIAEMKEHFENEVKQVPKQKVESKRKSKIQRNKIQNRHR